MKPSYLGAAVAVVLLAVIGFEMTHRSAARTDRVAPNVLTVPVYATLPKLPPAPVGPQLTVRWPSSGTLRVAFVGTSITAGWGASAETRTYTSIVETALAKHGATAVVAPTRIPGGLTFARSFAAAQPAVDLAFIELGTNDVKRTRVGNFSATYRDVIHRLQLSSPDVQVVCLSVWHTTIDGAAMPYDAAISAACNGIYVDAGHIFDLTGTRGPLGRHVWTGNVDEFHPNDLGHENIAGNVLAALKLPATH